MPSAFDVKEDEDDYEELIFGVDNLINQLDNLNCARASTKDSIKTLPTPHIANEDEDENITEAQSYDGPRIHLPLEVIIEIVSYLGAKDGLYNLCLVSRIWNQAATAPLYARPRLTYSNFQQFARTVAPTVKTPQIHAYTLGHLVKELNLSRVTYLEHLRMLTARLLSHTAPSLVSFTPPQKSFSGTALRNLKHTENLVYLDLSSCFETVNLTELFGVITSSLRKLETLHFPTSGNFYYGTINNTASGGSSNKKVVSPATAFDYPPNLKVLSLRSGLTDATLMSVHSHPPPSLRKLHLSHFAFISYHAARHFLNRVSSHITSLTIQHPFSRLRYNALNNILVICPYVTVLCISVDYITSRLFDDSSNTPPECPLERLDLDASETLGANMKVRPDDITIALMEGRLKRLRMIRASLKLGWGRLQERENVKDLAELLSSDRTHIGEEEEDDDDSEEIEDNNGALDVESSIGKEEKDQEENDSRESGLWLF